MRNNEDFLRFLLCIVALAIVICLIGGVAHADWNDAGSEIVQDEIWGILMDEFNNPIAAAAVMGNVSAESNFCPWRYGNDGDVKNDYSDSKKYVDNCTKNKFIYRWLYTEPGFGLYQFSTNDHMRSLWDLAEEQGAPVYDVKLQTKYILNALKERNQKAYEALASSEDLVDATEIFRAYGEGSTSNEQSVLHRIYRAVAAYEKFTGEEYTGEIYIPVFNGGSMWRLKLGGAG